VAPDRVSAYEALVLQELRAWKDPPRTIWGRAGERLERVIASIMARVPLRLVEKVLQWILPRFRRMTWRATSQKLVIRAYQQAGAPVRAIGDIGRLDLEVADRVAKDKRLHEGAVAGVGGAAAGFFGGFALAADIASVMLLSMRAVQSRGLAYGFDPSAEEELAFVLQVLDAAARVSPDSKASARTAVSVAGRQISNRAVLARIVEETMQRLPKQLVARLGAMKSESVAPFLGAVTSAAFNAWYLQAVTGTARMAYRERFLRRKHGSELLAAYGL